MKDYNGHDDNHTIREYKSVSEIPQHIIDDLGIKKNAMPPFFVLFVDACFEGMYENILDALEASKLIARLPAQEC